MKKDGLDDLKSKKRTKTVVSREGTLTKQWISSKMAIVIKTGPAALRQDEDGQVDKPTKGKVEEPLNDQ